MKKCKFRFPSYRIIGPHLDSRGLNGSITSRKDNGQQDMTDIYYHQLHPLLEQIKEVTNEQSKSSHVITVMLAIICVIITTVVVYCCFSNGISYLTRMSS